MYEVKISVTVSSILLDNSISSIILIISWLFHFFSPHNHQQNTHLSTLMLDYFSGTVSVFSHPVLSLTEEALLSDCQDLPNPDQAVLLSSTWQHHQSHARLQEGGARHRSGQALP